MRLSTVLLALLTAAPAVAQKTGYAVYASQADLDDGGTLSGALPTCLAFPGGFPYGPVGRLYFVDRASGAVAAFDAEAAPGARTTVVATAEALVAAVGAPVTGCLDADAAVVRIGNSGPEVRILFLALATDGGSVVLRLYDDGTLVRMTDPASTTDAGRGVTGIAYGEITPSRLPAVYLARSQRAGAPENGLYTLPIEAANETPSALALEPAADLVGLTSGFSYEEPLGVSSLLGEGEFQNVIVAPVGSALAIRERPCSGNAVCGGPLESAVTSYFFDQDYFVSYAIVFERRAGGGGRAITSGPYGVGGPFQEVFTTDGLVAATGIAGFAPAGHNGYMALVPNSMPSIFAPPTLLVAGSDEGGATPGIYAVDTFRGVDTEDGPDAPAARLGVAPNPASGRVSVRVTLDAPSEARVSVVDALGRRVAVLHDGPLAAGEQTFSLDTSALPAGVYVVRLGVAGVAARLVVAR